MRLNPKLFYVLLCSFGLTISCKKLRDPAPNYSYTVPDAQGELSTSSLAAEGMREELIVQATNRIIREEYKRVDGFLILRNNKLIYENYFHGHTADVPHNIFSAGKSITSILMGIAIDKGFIAGVDVPVKQLLPEYQSFANPDPRKDSITIAHLLNMSSGLECDDWYKQTESSMQKSSDWVKFTMDLPMANEPGSTGSYCTGGVVTLGRIIENSSGMRLEDFAVKYLFGPLGIHNYKWHIMPDGKASGGGLLFLRPRDMAKIGLLMLNKGKYNGQTIVSQGWVDDSEKNEIQLPGFDGYGHLWWKQAFDNHVESYFADGNGGQQIFIIPSKNLVIVFTGGNKNTSIGQQNFQIVNNYILPSIQ